MVGDNVEASGAVQEILDAAGEKAAQAKATKVFPSTAALSEEIVHEHSRHLDSTLMLGQSRVF